MRWILLALLLVVGCGGKPPIEYAVKDRVDIQGRVCIVCQISRQGTEREYEELASRVYKNADEKPGTDVSVMLVMKYTPGKTMPGAVFRFDPNMSNTVTTPGFALE